MHQVELHSLQSNTHPDFPKSSAFTGSHLISPSRCRCRICSRRRKKNSRKPTSCRFTSKGGCRYDQCVCIEKRVSGLPGLPGRRSGTALPGIGICHPCRLRRYLLSQPTWKLEPLLGICLEAADPSEEGIDDSTHRERSGALIFMCATADLCWITWIILPRRSTPICSPPNIVFLYSPANQVGFLRRGKMSGLSLIQYCFMDMAFRKIRKPITGGNRDYNLLEGLWIFYALTCRTNRCPAGSSPRLE